MGIVTGCTWTVTAATGTSLRSITALTRLIAALTGTLVAAFAACVVTWTWLIAALTACVVAWTWLITTLAACIVTGALLVSACIVAGTLLVAALTACIIAGTVYLTFGIAAEGRTANAWTHYAALTVISWGMIAIASILRAITVTV